jgi:excisionase family DNA binding protein
MLTLTPLPSPRKRGSSRDLSASSAIAVPPAEAGRLLSVSLSKIYDLMRDGELQSYRDGRNRRITVKSINKYVARQLALVGSGGWQAWEHNPARRREQAKASKARKQVAGKTK